MKETEERRSSRTETRIREAHRTPPKSWAAEMTTTEGLPDKNKPKHSKSRLENGSRETRPRSSQLILVRQASSTSTDSASSVLQAADGTLPIASRRK